MTDKKIHSRRNLFIVFFWTCARSALLQCEAFQSQPMSRGSSSSQRQPMARHVLAEPPGGIASFNSEGQPRKVPRVIRRKQKVRLNEKDDVWASGKWDKAVRVDSRMRDAVDAMQEAIRVAEKSNGQLEVYPLAFPGIRECNAALASFGDGGDLLRAMRLYFKMRKSASLSERHPAKIWQPVPKPTLVTFSTIMSRALYAGKPLVAIRLWNIMQRQPDFFSSNSSVPASARIVPDVKSVNILMNAYAKLGDVDTAQDLFEQMIDGGGYDVPKMSPNIVTYNTLLDACQKSGELDIALGVKERLDYAPEIKPDARTFTTLIATVARKETSFHGANDPTMAFLFLEEMKSLNIKPNGMTYSALIDVCGRCRRSDLALKGLRLMLDQRAQEQKELPVGSRMGYTLSSEVGAWTAAIDACGKSGSIDTALKLFYSMPKFGVFPNTITCGSIMDCLLRKGRTSESLEILRYMKKNGIAPSEVMYTSLMTSASRLAQYENQQMIHDPGRVDNEEEAFLRLENPGTTKAVEVYTELMRSLSEAPKRGTKKGEEDPSEFFRVSLVFQEMKSAGVKPDLACYNALLKSCSKSGDVSRALEVLDQIRSADDMDPDEQTWNSIIRAAGKAGRTDVALSTWKAAVDDVVGRSDDKMWTRRRNLSDRSLGALISALIQSAEDENIDRLTEVRLYQLVVKIWEALSSGSEFLGMNLVNREKVVQSTRIMGFILHSIVSLENFVLVDNEDMKIEHEHLKGLATSIIKLPCFDEGLRSLRRNPAFATAFQKAKSWSR